MITARTMIAAVGGVGVLAAVAGCGLDVPSSGPAPSQSTAPAMPSSLTCTFSATTADVVVQITGPEPSCNPWQASLTATGLSWFEVTGSATSGATAARRCQLQANGLTMTVTASRRAEPAAGSICAAAKRDGWGLLG